MRILHLSDHYLPVLGGIETHVAGLAARQSACGHDVAVLTSTPRTADGRRSEDAGPVAVRRVRSTLSGARFDFTAFDVVHVHLSVVAPFSAPLAARAARCGVPTVVTVHSLWNGTGPVPMVAAALAGLRSAPVHWTAVSRVAAEQLRHRLPAGARVGMLPNAVDVSPRENAPPDAENQPLRLVSTMRVARRKRPLPLLAMFEALRCSTDVPVRLTVIGDGPLRPRFERRVVRAGLQDLVEVTGRLEPSDVLGLLQKADLYVAPAVLESFGLAALEARSVGLPVVGHADSGMTEFVRHGVEGLLCTDDAGMVDSLGELVTNDVLRHRISEHNRTVPAEMTWQNALDAHETTYDRAISASTRVHGALRPAGQR